MQAAEWHCIEDVGLKGLDSEELEDCAESKDAAEHVIGENSVKAVHLIVDLARSDLIEELGPNESVVADGGPVIGS